MLCCVSLRRLEITVAYLLGQSDTAVTMSHTMHVYLSHATDVSALPLYFQMIACTLQFSVCTSHFCLAYSTKQEPTLYFTAMHMHTVSGQVIRYTGTIIYVYGIQHLYICGIKCLCGRSKCHVAAALCINDYK